MRVSAFVAVPGLIALVLVACGGGGDDAATAASTSSGAGASGAPAAGTAGAGQAGASPKGGAAGAAADAGKAGAAGSAGLGGQAGQPGGSGGAGSSGAGGASGKGGAGAAGASGAAGVAGSVGGAGAAGSSGASGKAAAAGAAGASVAGCAVDADCKAPVAVPTGCALAVCDAMSKACRYPSRDADGDGHATNKCKAADPAIAVEVGDDCDDTDKSTFPGAWDGPAGEGHPSHCGDGIDQDCNGVVDDAKLTNGATCVCAPGDVVGCSEEANGKPIFWPAGSPKGICKLGAKTCLPGGVFGPCTGAISPGTESCNGLDDDCDGNVDDGPPADAPYWRYDGDDDLHAKIGFDYVKQCEAPIVSPVECPTCPGTTMSGQSHWKTNVPADDCDDQKAQLNPSAAEKCDLVDNNCDGTVDEGCTCTDGDTRACGSASTCNVGSQICAAGLWGACDGGPSQLQVKYCLDGDADQYCVLDATCKLACPSTLGPEWRKESDCTGFSSGKSDCNDGSGAIHPAASELCGDGVDSDCEGGDSNGYSVGSTCDALAKSAGACKDGGLFICSGSLATSCPPTNPDVGKSFAHDKAAPNGSWDWDCSGTIERDPPISGITLSVGSGTCGNSPSRSCPSDENDCLPGMIPDIYMYSSPKNVPGCATAQAFPCGSTVSRVSCVLRTIQGTTYCASMITATGVQKCY